MPDSMKDKYQSCTCADISKLKNAGIDYKFTPLEEGVEKYVKWLKENSKCQKIQN
jgi:ADP-L-glycero-D-manno-heptose 6-epimerase